MRAVRIPAEGPVVVEDTAITLSYLEHAVDGRSEHIDIPHRGLSMYVNEHGERIGLPVNDRATEVAWYTLGGGVILGDVVVLGPARNGNHTDVPQAFIDMLEAAGWLEEDDDGAAG